MQDGLTTKKRPGIQLFKNPIHFSCEATNLAPAEEVPCGMTPTWPSYLEAREVCLDTVFPHLLRPFASSSVCCGVLRSVPSLPMVWGVRLTEADLVESHCSETCATQTPSHLIVSTFHRMDGRQLPNVK